MGCWDLICTKPAVGLGKEEMVTLAQDFHPNLSDLSWLVFGLLFQEIPVVNWYFTCLEPPCLRTIYHLYTGFLIVSGHCFCHSLVVHRKGSGTGGRHCWDVNSDWTLSFYTSRQWLSNLKLVNDLTSKDQLWCCHLIFSVLSANDKSYWSAKDESHWSGSTIGCQTFGLSLKPRRVHGVGSMNVFTVPLVAIFSTALRRSVSRWLPVNMSWRFSILHRSFRIKRYLFSCLNTCLTTCRNGPHPGFCLWTPHRVANIGHTIIACQLSHKLFKFFLMPQSCNGRFTYQFTE